MENKISSLFNTIQLLKAYEQAIDENIISSITDMRGIIVHANEKFCEVSKYSANEIIGQNHRIINSGYHPKDFFITMWQTIRRGDVWHNEIRNKAKDGTCYWVDTVIVPIKDENEKFTHYLSLRTLVTARKELEKKNELHTISLEELNKELEKYSYVISHDLKAPLQKIASLTDMLLDEIIKTGNTEELKTISNYIHQSISSAEKIITETLAAAKEKKGLLDNELINVKELLDEISKLIIIPTHFKLTVNCAFPFIPGKKVHLLQVLMNLLTNAIKYNDKPEGEIYLKCTESNENYLFSFSDNGKGISSEKLSTLFKLFEKDSNKSVDSHGVGLSIVKSIVEARGGKINVTSEIGKGTSIEFTWPKISH